MPALTQHTSLRRALGALSALAALSLAPASAHAQAAPAMHWGAMELQTSLANCIGRARKAYYDLHLADQQVTKWQVYGRQGVADVLVSCSPHTNTSSYLMVVASSADSKAAELLRNDVRSRIAGMREFD